MKLLNLLTPDSQEGAWRNVGCFDNTPSFLQPDSNSDNLILTKFSNTPTFRLAVLTEESWSKRESRRAARCHDKII
jgi:hypothetical protein